MHYKDLIKRFNLELRYITTLLDQKRLHDDTLKSHKTFEKNYFIGEKSNYENVSYPLEYLQNTILNERLIKISEYFVNLKGKRILDVGCGRGEFLNLCEKYNMKTYGNDISKHALKMTREKSSAVLKRLDAKWVVSFLF